MSRSSNYKTKQKDLILDIIKKQNGPFTVKDIYEKINEEIGLTTIYRFIDKLVIENRLNKSIGTDNITYYHYLEICECTNHFYLKCDICGNMIHVDCDCIDELTNHLFKKHNFKPNKDHIIINGFCEKCLKKDVNNL